MTVTVLLFAAAKELAGRDAAMMAVPSGAVVADLRAALAAAFPQLASLLPRCVVAVNHDFAEDSRLLNAADEIAIIPPVSGG